MVNSLTPVLDGNILSVNTMLNHPTALRDHVAQDVDKQIVAPYFYTTVGVKVEGGGVVYATAKASDYYTATRAEQRAPGGEYKVLDTVPIEPKLALPQDWGSKIQILEEERLRNNISAVDLKVDQVTNEIAQQVDESALDAIEDALGSANTVTGHIWADTILDGATLTAPGSRPTADWSAAQLKSDLQRLGVKHDTLIVPPDAAHSLRVVYGDRLGEVMESAGLTLVTSTRIAMNAAYVVEKGRAGSLHFEVPLTTKVIPDPATRSDWVQVYCVPVFVVDRPHAIKQIIGISA